MGDEVFSEWAPSCRPYVDLLRAFIEGRLSGEAFEQAFLPLYQDDPALPPGEIVNVPDGFLAALTS